MKLITDFEIEKWFTYHAPHGNQQERYVALRNKAKELALLIIEHTPSSADQSTAIRLLRESIMTANAAIACED